MKLPVYTRSEFITRMHELIEELERDHFAMTDIGCGEQGTFDFWMGELTNAEENA